jgi:4-aminobutyrate aminotransferase / (S)-3-amino-2-methylpropionate transaminase / 5-aminovalerate transaminase
MPADIENKRKKFIPQGLVSATACYVERAQGARVYDIHGNAYIDFSGGIAVMNVGHSHPKVVEAIQDQASKFTHTCFMVMPYGPAIDLAEKLCALVPGSSEKSALFINSGAEAVENAVKIARYHTKKSGLIVFENAFHGRTLLTMTLTSKVKPYKFGFGPFAPEVYRIPFAYCYRCAFGLEYPDCDVACADYLKEYFETQLAAETTAAVVAEPVQGEGGFICPPPEYFPRLKKICEECGVLLVADEIQTGIGRTGKMFAMEHWDVEADLTTVAKSLAAGMPLSAVVGKKDIMDSVHPGGVGGTYGGNPVCCRAALAVLDICDNENILERAQTLGKTVHARLKQFQAAFEAIGDVRGLGPMLAMELVKDRETKEPAADAAKKLVRSCYEKGLIVLTCGTFGNVIRLLMPLTIGSEELSKGMEILEEGLAGLHQ